MGDVDLAMIWKRLEEVQAGQAALFAEVREFRAETGQKVGGIATTLVGIQRDVRSLHWRAAKLAAIVTIRPLLGL